MALLRKQSSLWGGLQFPRIWEHPISGDIIVGGTAYDRYTFLPKIGVNVGYAWDTEAVPATATVLGDRLLAAGSTMSGANTSFTPAGWGGTVGASPTYSQVSTTSGSTFGTIGSILTGPRSIKVLRQINVDRNYFEAGPATGYTINSIPVSFDKRSEALRSDILSRDWYEQKNACNILFNSSTNRYMVCTDVGNPYNVVSGNPTYGTFTGDVGLNSSYRVANSVYMFAGLNTSGITSFTYSGTVATINWQNILASTTYVANTLLEANYGTTLVATEAANSFGGEFLTLMTTLNNGDQIFYKRYNSSGTAGNWRIIRNSANNVITNMTTNWTMSSWSFSIPSQMVRHHNSGSVNTNRKISYIGGYYSTSTLNSWPPDDSVPFQNGSNGFLQRISIDQSTGIVMSNNCTISDGSNLSNTSYNAFSTAYDYRFPNGHYDFRIMRQTTSATSQKWLLLSSIMAGSAPRTDLPFPNVAAPYFVPIYEISSSDDTSLSIVFWGNWVNILSYRAGSTSTFEKLPWCIAPLNQEHTRMMVFCPRTTHIVEFNTSTKALTETWFDENMVIFGVMWLDTGKVITDGYDMGLLTASGNTILGRTEQHVWSTDLVYRVDLIPSAGTVDYTGSNLSANVNVSTFNAANTRIASLLKLRVNGPATFDNGSNTKNVLTLTGGPKTENVTITGAGTLEYQVIEILGG